MECACHVLKKLVFSLFKFTSLPPNLLMPRRDALSICDCELVAYVEELLVEGDESVFNLNSNVSLGLPGKGRR